MLPEKWITAPGWSAYEVSSEGRIRRISSGKVLSTKLERNGYMRVCLCQGGKQKSVSVHRIVCEAFHGPCPSSARDATHANGIKLDNRSENLRWRSSKENQNEKRAHGTIAQGSRIAQSKLTDADVMAICAACERGEPRLKIARQYGIDKTNVGCIARRETWRHL